MPKLKLSLLALLALIFLACNVVVKKGSDDSKATEKSNPEVQPNIKPTTPSNLAASETKSTSSKLSWTASTDIDGSITGYELNYTVQGQNNYTVLKLSTDTNKTLTNLTANTSYKIRLRAKDNQGAYSDYSNSITVKTKTKTAKTKTVKKQWSKLLGTSSYDSCKML